MGGKRKNLALGVLWSPGQPLLLAPGLAGGKAEISYFSQPEQLLAGLKTGDLDLGLAPPLFNRQPTDDLVMAAAEAGRGLVALAAETPGVQGAVLAMRLGAFDYLPAPLDQPALDRLCQQAADLKRLQQAGGQEPAPGPLATIVGESPPMKRLKTLIQKVASTDSTVLILGESGTGKELVAKAIHAASPRRGGPLVPVNCGAIPHELLESELFGHEKGAFTGAHKARMGRFELAAGGTIFLDEIGDMSPLLQVKLLRVLQEKAFERVGGAASISADIRIIAATNQDLKKRVSEGAFREDLFYRLNVVPLNVPPLRERPEDIPDLCAHFVHLLAENRGLTPKAIDPGVMERFLSHNWPGNVRELENLLERMLILAEAESITTQDLPPRLGGGAGPTPWAAPAPAAGPDEEVDFNALVDAYERKLILSALNRTNWVKNRAAAMLKLNRTTLVEKIKKKKIEPPPEGGS